MFKLLTNKKGVSPLIATIFLMAFAVGLGAVVMQFSEGLVGNQEKGACSADFKLAVILCKESDTLKFTAMNVNKVKINGLKVVIEDVNGEGTLKKYSTDISRNNDFSEELNYKGNLQAVQFIPMIKEGISEKSKIHECNLGSIIYTKDKIKDC